MEVVTIRLENKYNEERWVGNALTQNVYKQTKMTNVSAVAWTTLQLNGIC